MMFLLVLWKSFLLFSSIILGFFGLVFTVAGTMCIVGRREKGDVRAGIFGIVYGMVMLTFALYTIAWLLFS